MTMNPPTEQLSKMNISSAKSASDEQLDSFAALFTIEPATTVTNERTEQAATMTHGKTLPATTFTTNESCTTVFPTTSVITATSGITSTIKCNTCNLDIEDEAFIQCPTVAAHQFCVFCTAESIEKQLDEQEESSFEEMYCPSGEKCVFPGSDEPWAFWNIEIISILKSC